MADRNEKDENFISVDSSDERMADAIAKARASVTSFLDAFSNPKPNQQSFLVKIKFEQDEAVEHIWIADLDLKSYPPTGVVANEPRISSVEYMQRIPIDLSDLSDWMYIEDGCLVGGFTARVMRSSVDAN